MYTISMIIDERLAQAMKRSLIILPESEKNGRNSSSQNSDLIKVIIVIHVVSKFSN